MKMSINKRRASARRDPEYRRIYAESHLDSMVATQIKVLREQRGWTQEQLAERAGMKQSRISEMEDVNYSAWSLSTLKRLAAAFGLCPVFSFETFDTISAVYSRELTRAFFERDTLPAVPAPAGEASRE